MGIFDRFRREREPRDAEAWFGKGKRKITYQDLPEKVRKAFSMVMRKVETGFDLETDPKSCIETLERISRKFPSFVPARLNLGALLRNTGDLEGARRTYQEVLDDYPDEIRAVAGLATVFADEKNYPEAERLAKQALEKGYVWPPCHSVIAQAREARGDVAGAAEAYLTAYQLYPHLWGNLREYCRLTGRDFHPPTEDVPQCITTEQLEDLLSFIEKRARGRCNHTLRFTTEWAAKNRVDVISLYQFLNAHGGFCDCEVCMNVEPSLLDE